MLDDRCRANRFQAVLTNTLIALCNSVLDGWGKRGLAPNERISGTVALQSEELPVCAYCRSTAIKQIGRFIPERHCQLIRQNHTLFEPTPPLTDILVCHTTIIPELLQYCQGFYKDFNATIS